jgi:hypothetical protein
MTALLSCDCSDSCQVDTTCRRPPRFQAHLDATERVQHRPIHRYTEACANHLGAMVHAMTTWAREQELTEGDLTIVTLDPPLGGRQLGRQPHRSGTQRSGLIFSVIPLST